MCQCHTELQESILLTDLLCRPYCVAQEYEAEHGFDNWQFWMHEMSSTDDDEESEEESEDGNAGGAIDEIERERRRLAKRRQRFEKRLRDEMKGILHWKPWH